MRSLCQSFLYVSALIVLLCVSGCDLEEFIDFISRLDQGDYVTASGNQGPYPGQGYVKLTFGLPLQGIHVSYFRNGEISHKFATNEFGIFPARRGRVQMTIGDIQLTDGPIWANLVSYPLITPMTLTGLAHSLSTDAEIINRVRFVYSLSNELQSYLNWQDSSQLDELPENIVIESNYHAAADGVDIDFDQSVENFSEDKEVINYLTSIERKLLPLDAVKAIFYQTLIVDQDRWGAAGVSSIVLNYRLERNQSYRINDVNGLTLASKSPPYGQCSSTMDKECSGIFESEGVGQVPLAELKFCIPQSEDIGQASFRLNGIEYEIVRYGYGRGLRLDIELVGSNQNSWFFSVSDRYEIRTTTGTVNSLFEFEANEELSFVKQCARKVENNE